MGWDPWEDIKDGFESALGEIGDALESIGGTVANAFGDWFDATANFMTFGLYDRAGDYLDDLFEQPTPPAPSSYMSDRKSTVRAPASYRSVIYGFARVGGQVAYLESSGPDDEYLHIIVVFAAHPCDGIRRLYFGDDVAVVESPIGSRNYEVQGSYVDHVDVHVENGNQTGVATSMLNMTPDNWTSDHKLLGQTYAYFRLKYHKDLFNGIPRITAQVAGKNDVYNPATGVTGFTTNHAACVRDYMIWDRGYGLDPSSLDEESFVEGANISDEVVTEGWIGFFDIKRYTVNGAFKINTRPPKILEDLLNAGAASVVNAQGKWFYIAGKYKEPDPDAYYTVDDLIGSISLAPGAAKNARINYAKGVFISPDHDYEEVDFVPIAINDYIDRDGEVLEKDFAYPFTNEGSIARRISKIKIEKNRYGLSATVTGRPYMFKHKVGDRIGLTVPSLGWSRRVFRIEDIPSFSPMSGIQYKLREDVAAIYDWTEGEELSVPVPPAVNLPNPYSLLAPINLAVTENPYTDSNGQVRVQVEFIYQKGSLATDTFDVEVKRSASAVWRRVYSNWSDTTAVLFDLAPGNTDFRVRGKNAIGTYSNWTSITQALAGIEGEAALAPESIALTGLVDTPPSPLANFTTIRVEVTPPSDQNYSHAVIQYQITGDPSWIEVGPTDANNRRDIVVNTDGTSYTVRAFSVSTAGVASFNAVTASITVPDKNSQGDIPTISSLAAPTNLQVSGGGTTFDGRDAVIVWTDPNSGSLLVRNYQVTIKDGSGNVMRAATATDPSFTYTYEMNAEDYEDFNGSKGVNRSYTVEVKIIGRLDGGGLVHESTVTTIGISNPAPALPTGLSLVGGYRQLRVRFTKPTDLDYIETRIYMGTSTGFAVGTASYVASAYDGSTTIGGLVDDQNYYIRLVTYDAYGPGTTSAEINVKTADLGLGAWAFVTQPDRAFIDANMENDAIPSTKIESLVAGRIATGTLAATTQISAGDPLTKPYTVTLGGKDFGVEGVALISAEENATGDAVFAVFESGQVKLNENANVFASGGFLFGDQTETNNFIGFDGSVLEIETSQFSVDAAGNASFSGNITGATITGSLLRTSATGRRVEIDDANNQVVIYDSSNNQVCFLGATGTAGGGFGNPGSASAMVQAEATQDDQQAAFFKSSGFSGVGLEILADGGFSASIGININASGTAINANGGSIGVNAWGSSYDFYARDSGVYGPFTGAHDVLIPSNLSPEVGDILSVTGKVEKKSVGDTVHYVELPPANSKAAYGIYSKHHTTLSGDNRIAGLQKMPKAQYDAMKTAYAPCIINSVGEGQVNVCSENGDLEVGDFICTSNTPGKGMRYDGQDMRFVVAKCLENVVWAEEPSNVKMVACVYLCG